MSSIQKVTKANGEKGWRARYRDPDCKSREKWFERKVDAERHLASMTMSMLQGAYIDPAAGKVRLDEYSRKWAERQPWRANTRNRTMSVLNGHVLAQFGARELRSIRPSEIQAWVGSMVVDGLKPSTVSSYYRVLVTVMRSAVIDKLINESPCRAIKLPRRETSTSALVPLTTEQVRAIAAAAKPALQALVLVSAGLGLRQGEACGLTLDRVDWLRRKVTVDRQMLTVNGAQAAHGPVKTSASVRSLPLADSVAEVLSEHVRKFPPGPSGLLFVNDAGEALSRQRWADDYKAAAKVAGCTGSTSHDLRHHAASMLIAAGCSVKSVQNFLGHATAKETLDTYGHLWPDDEDRIRASIDAAMRAREGVVERAV